MVKKTIKIINKYGIHARPARMIVEAASKFNSDVLLSKNGEEINAKSIMGILMLEAKKDSKVILRIDGKDEKKAMKALQEVFKKISTFRELDEN